MCGTFVLQWMKLFMRNFRNDDMWSDAEQATYVQLATGVFGVFLLLWPAGIAESNDPDRRKLPTAIVPGNERAFSGPGLSAPAQNPSASTDAEEASAANRSDSETRLQRSIFLYGGLWGDNRFVELLSGATEIEDSYIWVVGLSRQLDRLYEHLLLEGEVNVGLHSGLQEHLEFNVSPVLRWTALPWDPLVNSSIAYGLGLSFATDKPEVETVEDKEASRFLFFMVGEVTFELTSTGSTAWETFVRIHHRSGGFETIIDAEGSNFLSLGLRYRF